jgi:hypothetical protein
LIHIKILLAVAEKYRPIGKVQQESGPANVVEVGAAAGSADLGEVIADIIILVKT